jgi:hypothetical protein
MAVLIDKTFIVNKDTTNFSNNTIIKKGTIVQVKMIGTMPNGDIRMTTNNGEIINSIDLKEQSMNPINMQQPVMKNRDVLTAEDKFYEKLGIKYHDTHMFGVDSRLKGRLLVAVVLVAGYFAYKKFKK